MRILVISCVAFGPVISILAGPEISAICLEQCSSAKPCVPITRWTEPTPRSTPPGIRIAATITNLEAADDLFLLSTTDYIIAPLYAYSATDFEKLRGGDEVSWGQFARDDDLRAIPIHCARSEAERSIDVRTLNLPRILADSPGDPADYLWPWLVRINVLLVDRDGRLRASRSTILELEPSKTRISKARARMKTSGPNPYEGCQR